MIIYFSSFPWWLRVDKEREIRKESRETLLKADGMEAAGSEGLAELFFMSPTNIQSFTSILASILAPDDKGHWDSRVSVGMPSLSWAPFRTSVHTEQSPYEALKQTISLPCPTSCCRRYQPGQWSPVFLAPGTGFKEDNFPTDWRGWWFRGDSSILHLLCTLFQLLLHQLHPRSSGIKSWRLGTSEPG